MTPMILGNNKEKIVNYCIRVIHGEDNKVKVVVVDKNNGDKVEGVITDDVPTGRYVDCDLTARLYVDYTDALPIGVEEPKDIRSVELVDIKSNDLMGQTVLVVKVNEKAPSVWIGLTITRRELINKLIGLVNDQVPNFIIPNCNVLEGTFVFYADIDEKPVIIHVIDNVRNIHYKFSFDDVKRVLR